MHATMAGVELLIGGVPRPSIMDPHRVFLHKHADLARRSAATKIDGEDAEYTALMAAPLVREFLMGSPSIVDLVNDSRTRIRYRFVPLGNPPITNDLAFQAVLDGFDPDTAPGSPTTVEAGRDRLLKARIGALGDPAIHVTVRDVVDFTANAAGGVHIGDIDRGNRRVVAALNNSATVNGYENVIYMLMAIGRVVVTGLQPLADLLRARE